MLLSLALLALSATPEPEPLPPPAPGAPAAPPASGAIHTTYLWHLHQPIYWPDQRRDGFADEYETAWESLQQKNGGAFHPENDLAGIFGKDDRVAAYQWRTRDSIASILHHADGGAQISYSGALIENVVGLGGAGQLGYSSGWNGPILEAHGWTTSGGKPRAELVSLAHHHALMPLHSERTQWLQVRLHQERMAQAWGIQPGEAKGFFPPETSFSERMIPVLASLGIEWTFVSNEHLSRACPDFPVVLGSGGVMCDPPNRADQINPPGVDYWRKFIDRGCSPTNAYPFAYVPHRAQYVDPDTGAISSLIVVPTAQALSWDDGYGPLGGNALDGIAAGNDPQRPMLVVLAHDGDNAWGGGYSYYQEAVKGFCDQAASLGYSPSMVEEYLADHPVPSNDVVHVEDGSWVNADSDFGSPSFINWLYPLVQADGTVDPIGGWHYKAREYAIFTAAENRIRTAEDAAGGPASTRIEHVLDPGFGTSPVERAWSYYLASMDSGNVYFGNPLDFEVKGTVGCNEAFEHVDPLIAAMAPQDDTTDPTVFVPQRHPYNPGGLNFGVQYGYQSFVGDGSFVVWTFADDVSGIASATLRYRVDADGANPIASIQNETYAGGPEVGAWQSIAMDGRDFPADNVHGWGGLEAYAFEQPDHIARHYSATVPAHPESLLDYYVEVVDTRGNAHRTAIQHVYVGEGAAPVGDVVTSDPEPPVQGQPATIRYDAAGRALEGAAAVYLHVGFDDWAAGTVQHLAMTEVADDVWERVFPIPASATQVDCAFNDDPEGDGGTWDNNGGADWHLATTPPEPGGGPVAEFEATPLSGVAPLEVQFTSLATGAPTSYAWDFDGDGATDSVEPDPTHVFGAGSHTVSLTVASSLGQDTETKVDYVVAVPQPGVPTGPVLELDTRRISVRTALGTSPRPEAFGVRNAGVGELGWTASVAGAGGAPRWLGVRPGAGDSTGEWDRVAVHFDAARLPAGLHTARIVVDGDGANAPQAIDVELVVGLPIPTATGVDPDPPIAGQTARIWYLAAGGPLAGAPGVLAHWGLDGWQSGTIADEAMAEAAPDVWFLDVALPVGTFELDFVFTDGQGTWDNNGGADWIFAVLPAPPGPPVLQVAPTAVSASAVAGQGAPAQSFGVSNGGGGTFAWTLALVDTGDGTSWLSASPAAGAVSDETDTVSVSLDAAALAPGTYGARVDVVAPGLGTTLSVDVTFAVEEPQPAGTTVVPNPPVAGATARIWYASSGGPLAGAGGVLCHWGLDGWDPATIRDDPMTAASGGSWFLDVALPATATELDFVFTDGQGSWDNNGGADWIFAVDPPAPTGPAISLSTGALSASTDEGSSPAPSAFTVANAGSGTLIWGTTLVDTGSGTGWLSVSPGAGVSTGEADSLTVSFAAASLAPGSYDARIEVFGNAANSPQVVDVGLTVAAAPVASPITIGAGPSIGTNTAGTMYFEQLQDWRFGDVRGLDVPDDATSLGDGYDGSRDLVALYSRLEGDALFLRADLFELGVFAEQGNLDLYVLIDCAPGGALALPNGLGGGVFSPWELAVATYDAANLDVLDASGASVAGAHLGAHFRSDLDAVELGVARSALLAAGWDGQSPLRFHALTAKDFGSAPTDQLGQLGDVTSASTTGRAKLATIAHGNQSLGRQDTLRDRLYVDGSATGTGAPSGFRLTLDTHRILGLPLNVHLSGTLIAALLWLEDANPIWDGPTFLEDVGRTVDADQVTEPGAMIGGVYSEHMLPYFAGQVTRDSFDHFEALALEVWGLSAAQMGVMHVPERVIHARAIEPDPFDDIAASDYVATYLDEVAHFRDWFYPADPWTGVGGQYGLARQHELHRVEGVLCFQINDLEDGLKFAPQDGGAHSELRRNLLLKALDPDGSQLTLVFDDWEAIAGWSFGSGYNDNAIGYDRTMRWIANHPWIEVVTLHEVLARATDTGHPQYDAGWIAADHGAVGDRPLLAYDWLHHATEDSYDTWYHGGPLEEPFSSAVPVSAGHLGAGPPIASGRSFGDLGTPGTLIHDTWQAISSAPEGAARELAELAFQAGLFETAWHDEDSFDVARDPATNHHTWLFPDTTYDRISGFALELQGHLRDAAVTASAAAWAGSVASGQHGGGVSASAVDLDLDGEPEYVLSNGRLWLAFEARGGRCVQAFAFDASAGEAYTILGTPPIVHPSGQGEEERTQTARRCSGFKDMNQDAYADAFYTASVQAGGLLFTSPDGSIAKSFSLTPGSGALAVSYTSSLGQPVYTRLGVSVNGLDLAKRGRNFTSTYGGSSFTQTNHALGSLTVSAGAGASIQPLPDFDRFVIPLTEQVEVRLEPGAASFTVSVP